MAGVAMFLARPWLLGPCCRLLLAFPFPLAFRIDPLLLRAVVVPLVLATIVLVSAKSIKIDQLEYGFCGEN